MQIKSKLRKEAREKRKQLVNTANIDLSIEKRLLSLDEYKTAKTVLIYVSLNDEIKTDNIINSALADGKLVAAAFCVDKCGTMEFYIISSLSDLKEGSFGIREPDKTKCRKLEDISESIIIVPGLLFDKQGFRLGFGRGYYDRFLANNRIFSIGLCYDEMIVSEVPRNEYDRKVDLIVTQSEIINC